MRRWHRWGTSKGIGPAIVATALVVTACSGADPAPDGSRVTSVAPSVAPTGGPTAAPASDATEEAVVSGLDELRLAASAAVSFQKVAIEGLDDAVAVTTVAHLDGFDVLPRPVFLDEDGPYIIAPLHPLEPAGGTLALRFENPNGVGPTIELDVTAPPLAAGSFDEAHDTLVKAIELRASGAGLSLVQLRTDAFEDLPPLVRHLKVALSWSDLAADARAELDDDAASLLDQLTAGASLKEAFAREATAIPEELALAAGSPGTGGAAGALAFAGPLSDATAAAASLDAAPLAGSVGDCFTYGIEIDSVDDLSDAMLSTSAADSLSANPGRVLEAASWVIAAGGLVPGEIGTVASVMGLELAAFEAAMNGIGGLRPSHLTAMTASVGPTSFDEDSTVTGVWQNVQVTAASHGWVADADAINILLNLIGIFAPGAKQGATIEEVIAGLGDELLEPVGELTNRLVNEVLQNLGTGVLSFCAETWTVPVQSNAHLIGTSTDGRFDVDDGAFTFKPLEAGTDTLRLEARRTSFAGRYISLDTPLETKRIIVRVVPSLIVIDEPGEIVTLNAEIENAETESLFWDSGPGRWLDGVGDDTNGPQERRLETPSDAALYPYVVRVESTTDSGPRESRTPPRFGIVTIVLEGFALAAVPDEIEPGGVSAIRAYTIDDAGNEQPVDVSFAVSSGDLTETGTGTAAFTSTEVGTHTVTATDAQGRSRSVNVYVIGGDCAFNYVIDGTQFIGQPGDVLTWSDRDDDESRLLMGDPRGQTYQAQMTFTTNGRGARRDAVRVTGPGTYEVRFTDFMLQGESLAASVSTSGEVTITEYEDGVRVAGQGSGGAIRSFVEDPIPYSFDFTIFDSGEHNFSNAGFECYVGGETP